MKKNNCTIIGISLFAFFSCGPSAEQRAVTEKAKMDSVALATKNHIMAEKAIQDSIAAYAEKEAVGAAMDQVFQEQLKTQLIELKAQLAAEDVKMDGIKSYHIGRLENEKMQQISDQTMVIEKLKNEISDIEKQIK